MHPWAETFPRAAGSLALAERKTLEARPARELAVKNLVFSSDRDGMMDLFGVVPSASGSYVAPETAMRLSAVYASTRLIAGAVATLPLPIYRLEDNGTRSAQRDHPFWPLLNEQPTPPFSAATFWEFATGSMLLRGDAFAVLVRNKAAIATEIIPVPTDCVTVRRLDGRLVYHIQNVNGNTNFPTGVQSFDQDDVLHFPGFGFDGLRSMSVVRWAAFNAIGTGLATEEYAGKFFSNGATPKVVITSPGDMSSEQLDKLRNAWTEKYGGTDNTHKPLILWGGMAANALSLNAEDSQLLDSRRFQVEDIARAFGVPPHMIGATDKTTSWGAGVEAMGQGFLTYTLLPHLNRFQQEINRKLFKISRYFVEFNTDGLLQTNAEVRAKVTREQLGGSQGPGYKTINEVRKTENMPPIDGGDALYVPKGPSNAPQSPAPAAAAA